jgi:hypothetical protein
MSFESRYCQFPAPCIVESGILVNKDDIKRLLNDLTYVAYVHSLDGKIQNQGKGWILEVFSDLNQATLVVNNSLYINIQSFDYLQINQLSDSKTCFDLIQDNRQLRIVPLNNPVQEQQESDLDTATLEAMLTEVLSAKWDVQIDDDF